MRLESFFENFEQLAAVPNGMQKLRELILQLAVQGKLMPQDPNDEPGSALLEKIKVEKGQLAKEKKIKRGEPLSPVKTDEAPFELPKDWEWVKANEITSLITDGEHATPPRINQPAVPLVTAKNVRNGFLDLTTVDYVSSETALKCWTRCDPQHDDILMVCVGATTGRLTLLKSPPRFVLVRSVALIRPMHRYVYPEFLALSIKSPIGQSQIWGNVKQSAQPCLYINKIQRLLLPLPPLTEQRRIVAKVDKLMALCDELEARQQEQQAVLVRLNNAALDQLLTARAPEEFAEHWQRIRDNFELLYDTPETIGKLRQAILKFAFQGLLTPVNGLSRPVVVEPIEKNIHPLHCKGAFEIPETWAWSFLEVLCEQVGDIDHKMPKATNEGVPFLSAKDLKDDGTIDFRNPKLISEEDYERLSRKIKPKRGDIIYSRIGARLGKARLVETGKRFLISYSCCLIRPNHKIVDNKFLQLFLDSDLALSQAVKGTQSIGVPDLGLGEIKKYKVPVPPLVEQKMIVEKIVHYTKLCDDLEAKLKDAQAASGKLLEATVKHLLT